MGFNEATLVDISALELAISAPDHVISAPEPGTSLPVRGRSRGEAKALTHVMALIASQGLQPGDRLPTERELAERIGSSRGTVRRALTQLEENGVVIRQVGRGTFLTRPLDLEPLMETSPAEILAVRIALEPSIAALATSQASIRDIRRLEEALQQGESASTHAGFEEWDAVFHRTISDSVHNNLLNAIMEPLHKARLSPVWGELKRRNFDDASRRVYETQHRNVLAAIIARDPSAASSAMRQHLLTARNNVFGT